MLIAWNDYLYTGNAASLEHFYADLKAKRMACSVYGSQFLMEALYAAHEADFALS